MRREIAPPASILSVFFVVIVLPLTWRIRDGEFMKTLLFSFIIASPLDDVMHNKRNANTLLTWAHHLLMKDD
jgi:hypothetical protein